MGITPRDIDRYTRDGLLHPIFASKGGEAAYPEWELNQLKLRLVGTTPDSAGRKEEYSDRIWKLLTCPQCGKSLSKSSSGAACSACSLEYTYSSRGALDLRPKRQKTYSVEFPIDPPGSKFSMEGLHPATAKQHVDEWNREHWPKKPDHLGVALELGCADIVQKETVEQAGFEYLGVDYDSAHAPMLVDAHTLPFLDDSFAFILAFAFLEHIQYPPVAMRETFRVLQPGGTLLGSVSFLEPFHMNSFYHHTHLGVLNTLRHAGFSNVSVIPSPDWTGPVAQAYMGLFPGISVSIAKKLMAPLGFFHRMWWRGIRRTHADWYPEDARVRNTTGAFTFYATKER